MQYKAKTKTWYLVKDFDGAPKPSDFELEAKDKTFDTKDMKPGEVLFEAICFSVDPYLRVHGEVMGKDPNAGGKRIMHGTQVVRVALTNNAKFPLGARYVTNFGWRTHVLINPDNFPSHFGGIMPYPELGDLPESLALGACGMPGNTAYFGFLRLCEPKKGETVVVNAAAGAVGSLVGQIAKLQGCRVIGYAGADDKVKWLKEELGFDYAYNYKTTDLATTLKEAAPNGVDCYFDNVGGDFSTIVMSHMNKYGRISLCGCISVYNTIEDLPQTKCLQPLILFKELRLEGFVVSRWTPEWYKGCNQMRDWINEGKIKFRETVWDGAEKLPQAFMEMLRGVNTGKAIVTAGEVKAA